MMMQMVGAFAEFERAMIRERSDGADVSACHHRLCPVSFPLTPRVPTRDESG
jgi:hypothetical protein